MPRLRDDQQSQSETLSLHLRTDVLLSRRDGDKEIKDRTLVWNLVVEIPVWSTRLQADPEGILVNQISGLIERQFRENGLMLEIAQKTANLLAQDM